MADVHVPSDGEDDISVTGNSSNHALDSDEDSLLGFEDDLEGDDEEVDIGEPTTSNETSKNNGEVAKRKRKKIDPSKRKRIRRILREDELTDVTISAQKEERERLRRLELQKSLATAASNSLPSSKVVENLRSESPISTSKPSSPVAVDVREKKDGEPHIIVIDSDEEGDSESQCSTVNYCQCDSQRSTENLNGDLIEIISSDSEVEVDDSGDDDDDDDNDNEIGGLNACKHNDVDYDNSGLHANDSANQVDPQGRVLVNVNHPLDEKDIFLAPQIAKVIKAHQV